MKKLLTLLSFFITFNLFAAVPNSLSTGDTVDASKLNANFAANAKRWYYKNNGTVLGEMTSRGEYITGKGYVGSVLPSSTTASYYRYWTTYYTTSDCTGTAYAAIAYLVIASYDGNTYYTVTSDTPASITFNSYHSTSSTCGTTTGTAYLVQAYTNVEATTGVPNYPLSGPITLVYE